MKALLIIFFILALLYLLPVGVHAVYDSDGARIRLLAGLVRITLTPKKPKTSAEIAEEKEKKKQKKQSSAEKKRIKAEKAKRKKEKQRQKSYEKAVKDARKRGIPIPEEQQDKPKKKDIGGLLSLLFPMLAKVGVFLKGFFHKLIIKKLEIQFFHGGKDPAAVAENYGKTVAAVHAVLPIFHQLFNIKKESIQIGYLPDIEEARVKVNAVAVIRLGTLIRLVFTLGFGALRIFLQNKTKKKTKGGAEK